MKEKELQEIIRELYKLWKEQKIDDIGFILTQVINKIGK